MTAVALGWHADIELSPAVLLALAPLVLLVIGLWAYCLRDLARAPTVRYLSKPLWALVIVLGSTPLGALAYLILGRDRDAGSSAAATIRTPSEEATSQRPPAGVAGRN